MDLSDWEWTCACCNKRHRGIPDYAFSGPLLHHQAAADPAIEVIEKTEDGCIIDAAGSRHYFIRCMLQLPVLEPGGEIGFGVWCSLGRRDFERYEQTFDEPYQALLGVMPGQLSNEPPGYPESLDLRLDVHPQNDRMRPKLIVQDDQMDHPLCRDQHEGIGPARLAELLPILMPCDGSA